MVPRYENLDIKKVFSDKSKLDLWQKTELAVIEAMAKLGLIDVIYYNEIKNTLINIPIDIEWCEKEDKKIHHDLNAFLHERLKNLDSRLHQYFHKNITSYDTEEPAFARSLSDASEIIKLLNITLENTLKNLAVKYRYVIMNARTHGQEAEMQSFGSRVLTWLCDYKIAYNAFLYSLDNLKYSKLSGAIGKYGSLDPKIEEEALSILGFVPFYGSTQIMPRILYAPIAQSLCNLLLVIQKIGLDIRLASRSGKPLMQEPFKKKQTGSSAMPHKKNTIRTEQLEGMARMAKGYMIMITDNISTWEERAIEQSSVERVAWQDLFHVTAQSLKVLNGVLNGLQVYQDNMLQEIVESRGVYASSEVKEFLKEKLSETGLSYEDVYKIVQLASFNVFEPSSKKKTIREANFLNHVESYAFLMQVENMEPQKYVSIRDHIFQAKLHISENLEITQEKIDIYNEALVKLFYSGTNKNIINEWDKLFDPTFLLKNENFLFEKILNM
ncbi:MAG: lyase family protein [Burkholderiales bacterium]|nr:lyase family protein [Burkholderiales bacterium]